MAIYTVFFVREDALVPDFELGDFGTVDDALRGAGEMVRQYGPILRAEIYHQNRQVAVWSPPQHSGVAGRQPQHG